MMKIIISLTASSLLLVGILSCTNNTYSLEDSGFPKVITIDPSEANTDSMNLSEIASKIEYIPLQTTDSSLMDYFNVFDVTKDNFFIKNGQSVLVYDKSGKFVTSLFAVGRGPGETLASYLTVDKINNLVYVLDYRSKSVNIYNNNGRYINTLRKQINSPEHMTWAIGFFDNKLFISTAQKPNVKYLYSCFDLKNDSIHILYKNYRTYEKSQFHKNQITPYDYHYQITESGILFKERYSDTIFKANKDLIPQPRYIIDLGNNKLTWEEWRDHGMFWDFAEGPPSGYVVQSFIETQNFLLIVLTSFKEPAIFALYNLYTDSMKIFKNKYYEKSDSQIFLRNDIDNLISFPPMNKHNFLFYYDECLYGIIEARNFTLAYQKASEKSKNSSEYLKNMAPVFRKITEFSNPLIMKVYLNDDPSSKIR